MNKVILLTGGIVTVAYLTEYFIGWYSGVPYENYTYLSFGAATGPYWWAFWALIICNLIVPLSLWVKSLRRNIMWTFFVALVINIGMWFERFDIIVVDLSKDRLTSSWTMFQPTFVDIGTFIGTIGFFFVLFLLYARTFPVIAQAEVKTILKSSGESFKRLRAEHGDDHSHVQTVEEYPADAGPSANVEDKDFDSSFNASDENVENNEVDFEAHRGKIDNLLSGIGTFDPSNQTQDDLKKISGVGPVMEQKLHQLGIFTFEQVSRMTDREYDLLDEIISEFPGRAKRDDWAGQALMLKNKN
jgi:molybdopterin-containing oxidoreductase family membrane subunit